MLARIVQSATWARLGRSATLASTIALARCDAQVLLGSMRGDPNDSDARVISTPTPNFDASVGGDGTGQGTSDAPVAPSDDAAADARETPDDIASRNDVAPPSDVAMPPDDVAPANDTAPPDDGPTISDTLSDDRAPTADAPTDGATCPSSSRAPVQCFGADASLPETPIESCPIASRTLLQHPMPIAFLRADAQGIYWRSSDGGMRILRKGESTPQLLAFTGAQPFAIDDDALYFGTPPGNGLMNILKVKRDGTGLTLIASEAISGSRIALGPDRVYYQPKTTGLASTPKSGSGPIFTVVEGQMVDNVVTDATHVYWKESSSDASAAAKSAIRRAPHGSTAAELVAPGLAIREFWEQGNSIVVLSDELSASGEHLASFFLEVPKTGGCTRVLVSLPASRFPPHITAVALDDRTIDWTSVLPSVGYGIWYAPRSGGIAVQASVAFSDENLALTPTQAFWANWTLPPILQGTLPTKTEVTTIQVMDRP